jgi:hypothetical protein
LTKQGLLVAPMTSTVLALALCSAAYPFEAQPPDLPVCPTRQDAPDVTALIERIEQTLEGRSTITTMTMSIRTESWSRRLRTTPWFASSRADRARRAS